jgi:hypothetical protein
LSRVLDSLPRAHREKYTQVHDFIERNPGVIGSTAKGRLTIHGDTVEDASYRDVIRALYINPRGGMSVIAPGLPEFVGALREIGVPRSLITSSTARAQYASMATPATQVPNVSSTRSCSLRRSSQYGTTQYGKGHIEQPCFPGRPIKCLRIY